MIRVGKPMANNTYVVYLRNEIKEVVYALSRVHAYEWARQNYGSEAYIMENVQARDITW